MILLVISLLTILAGTLLLAKFKKEAAGKLFAIISWFFIAVGCLLFIGFIVGAICRLSCHDPNCTNKFHHEWNMGKCDHGMPGKCAHMGMGMGMCSHGMMPGCCMTKDSTMPGCCMEHKGMIKPCPGHMQADSTKTAAPK